MPQPDVYDTVAIAHTGGKVGEGEKDRYMDKEIKNERVAPKGMNGGGELILTIPNGRMKCGEHHSDFRSITHSLMEAAENCIRWVR